MLVNLNKKGPLLTPAQKEFLKTLAPKVEDFKLEDQTRSPADCPAKKKGKLKRIFAGQQSLL